jgi:hypothetical protein
MWQSNYDPAAKEAQHRVAAKELLWLREQFLLLITACNLSTTPPDDLARRLESLTRELTAVYKFAPNTANEAYAKAKADLDRGHFTFAGDEVDRLLPQHLRKSRLDTLDAAKSLPFEK